MLQILPALAYAATALFLLRLAHPRPAGHTPNWIAPSVLAAFFLAFTAVTVLEEGLVQFWINHTTSLAGNQVWFDLLLAVAIAFYLLAARARAVNMPILPWALAVIATASLALLPMLARLLWLEQAARRR